MALGVVKNGQECIKDLLTMRKLVIAHMKK